MIKNANIILNDIFEEYQPAVPINMQGAICRFYLLDMLAKISLILL